jgi:hypothetical protein
MHSRIFRVLKMKNLVSLHPVGKNWWFLGSLPQTSMSQALDSPDTSLPNAMWWYILCSNDPYHIVGFH